MSCFFLFYPLDYLIGVVGILLILAGGRFLRPSTIQPTNGNFTVRPGTGAFVIAAGWMLEILAIFHGVLRSIQAETTLAFGLIVGLLGVWFFVFQKLCLRKYTFDSEGIAAVTFLLGARVFSWDDISGFVGSGEHIEIEFDDGGMLSIAGWLDGAPQLLNFLSTRFLDPDLNREPQPADLIDLEAWEDLMDKTILVITHIDNNFETGNHTELSGLVQGLEVDHMQVRLDGEEAGSLIALPLNSEAYAFADDELEIIPEDRFGEPDIISLTRSWL